MPRYKVFVRENAWSTVYIDAENENDAATLQGEIYEIVSTESEIVEVLEVEEIE